MSTKNSLKQHDKLAGSNQSSIIPTYASIIFSSSSLKFETIYYSYKLKEKKSLTPIIRSSSCMHWIFLFLRAVTALRRNWYSFYVFLNCEIRSLRKQISTETQSIFIKDSVNVNYLRHSSELWKFSLARAKLFHKIKMIIYKKGLVIWSFLFRMDICGIMPGLIHFSTKNLQSLHFYEQSPFFRDHKSRTFTEFWCLNV